MRLNVLTAMLDAEVAADAWWDGLSKKEQKVYIKAHPRSKYAKQAGGAKSASPAKITKSGKAAPTGDNALKMSNHIVKSYGGKRVNRFARGPYSSYQEFMHRIHPSKVDKIVNDLKGQGWNHEEMTKNLDTWHTLKHPDGGKLELRKNSGGEDKPYAFALTFGTKKAKDSKLPYYD